MEFTQHSFTQENQKMLMAVLAREASHANLHITDLPYRFSSWALDEPLNASLWYDARGLLAGWAVLQSPFWTVDLACTPAAEEHLYPAMLAWADARAGQVLQTPYGHPAWFVMVFPEQATRIRALQRAGFTCQADVGEFSWSKVLMQLSDPSPVRPTRLPAGFSIRPLAGRKEIAEYVQLHQTAFETRNMTVPWRENTLRHPSYRPDLDLVIEAQDGQLVAFCICWYDEATHTGQVEPLGCHARFARRGLGRAILTEGLRRLQALGAQSILVETDSYRNSAFRLYESAGFQVIHDVHVYRKDYEEN